MIEVDEQISTVRRTVGAKVLEAGEARTVTLSLAYKATVDELWDACTSAERIPRWFLPIEGDLRVGGTYQLQGNAGGTILTCDPPRSFSATWEYGDQVTWIEVRVTPEGDGARLELEHIVPVDDERWAEFGPGALGMGWDLGLIGLVLHLGGADVVDPQEVMAWQASDEGRAFMVRSGDAWHEADVAAGADPEASRARAERCKAAYLG